MIEASRPVVYREHAHGEQNNEHGGQHGVPRKRF